MGGRASGGLGPNSHFEPWRSRPTSTDHGYMGQTVHPGRRARAVALLAAGSLAATPFLAGCSSSVASSPTTLRGIVAATVVHTDGSTRPGINGLRLRPGDVVRNGTGGRAELITRDRVVYVGSEAAVQVV